MSIPGTWIDHQVVRRDLETPIFHPVVSSREFFLLPKFTTRESPSQCIMEFQILFFLTKQRKSMESPSCHLYLLVATGINRVSHKLAHDSRIQGPALYLRVMVFVCN